MRCEVAQAAIEVRNFAREAHADIDLPIRPRPGVHDGAEGMQSDRVGKPRPNEDAIASARDAESGADHAWRSRCRVRRGQTGPDPRSAHRKIDQDPLGDRAMGRRVQKLGDGSLFEGDGHPLRAATIVAQERGWYGEAEGDPLLRRLEAGDDHGHARIGHAIEGKSKSESLSGGERSLTGLEHRTTDRDRMVVEPLDRSLDRKRSGARVAAAEGEDRGRPLAVGEGRRQDRRQHLGDLRNLPFICGDRSAQEVKGAKCRVGPDSHEGRIGPSRGRLWPEIPDAGQFSDRVAELASPRMRTASGEFTPGEVVVATESQYHRDSAETARCLVSEPAVSGPSPFAGPPVPVASPPVAEPRDPSARSRPASGPPGEQSREPIRVPLTQLKRGERAIVDLKDLASEDSKLLAAMGLEHACEVRVCRAGTPCIVQVEATRLGISADVAAKIIATPCSCFPDVPAEGIAGLEGVAPDPQRPQKPDGATGGRDRDGRP
jgi:Fe2+ transport system protein FeoA